MPPTTEFLLPTICLQLALPQANCAFGTLLPSLLPLAKTSASHTHTQFGVSVTLPCWLLLASNCRPRRAHDMHQGLQRAVQPAISTATCHLGTVGHSATLGTRSNLAGYHFAGLCQSGLDRIWMPNWLTPTTSTTRELKMGMLVIATAIARKFIVMRAY